MIYIMICDVDVFGQIIVIKN